MFDYLGVTEKLTLERMGADGVIDRYLFRDFYFDLPEGLDAFEENLRQAFPKDREQITRVMESLRDISGGMDRLDGLLSPSRNLFMKESFFDSLGGLLRNENASPGFRSVLGMTCSWIGVPLDECPVYYHHMALASYLLSSWRCNGTQMAEAFVSRIQELGGTLLLGDPVEKVLVHERTAAGVVLKSGRILRAATVVGAVHPKTLLALLPADAVRPAYRDRVLHLRDTSGVFCANFLVNRRDHEEIPYNIFNVKTDGEGGVSDVVFYQLRATEKPGDARRRRSRERDPRRHAETGLR
jgi:phytoene dehydrogenase-like protein